MHNIGEYGFESDRVILIQRPQTIINDTFYQELWMHTAFAIVSHIAYRVTRIAFFKVFFTITCASFAISLARKVFQNYTFFQYCERKSEYITRKHPYLPLIAAVVATLTLRSLPAFSVSLSVATGILIGLKDRVEWFSSIIYGSA